MSTTPKVIDKGNGVRIIDPNPEFHTIEHEDLYVYASLVAKTKGKSFLTEKETGDFELDNVNVSSVDMAVQDSYQEKNPKDGGTIKRQFLTTNWTEIGGSQIKGGETADAGDLEGFGITNIDIEIKGSYIPKVVVDFVDIRGATLFEQGSCSPYGLFFHLPYPIFELTLKGYYGKPVTYYLNLVKFNTKFNASTGNFECRGEFVGWSYAFLADILMGYVRCSGYMDKWGAQDKLKEKYDNTIKYYLDNGIYDETDYLPYYEPNSGQVYVDGTNPPNTIVQPFCSKVVGDVIQCITIDELLLRIKDVKGFLADAKSDNDYIEVGGLLKVRNHLVKMQDKIRKFARLLEEDHKNKIKNGGPELTEVQNRNLREKYVFNSAPDEELKNYLKSYWGRPIKGNIEGAYQEITSYVPQAKEQLILDDGVTRVCGGKYVAVLSSFSRTNGLTGCQLYSDEESPLIYEVLDFLDKDTTKYKFQKGMLTDVNFGLNYTDVTNGGGDNFYIDLGFPLDAINKDIQKLDEQIETKRNFVKDSIDKGVVRALGFRPTIRNIFTILSCNVENFIELLLDCSIQAEEEHNTEGNKQGYNDRYGENGSSLDDKLLEAQGRGGNNEDLKTIYPWPTYYQTKYRSAASANANDKNTETKEVYPGINPDFFDWPEVRFVEDFIEACQKSNDVEELLKEDKTGLPGFDNYVPINPLESKLMDSNIECKYRGDLRSHVKEEVIDDITLKNIAERMFVTLDFSYFDPIRYNPNNIGLGFSYTYRNDAGSDKPIDLKYYQTQRLWMPTLYTSNTAKIVEDIARIDTHNLFSCITETEKLSKINLKIGSGSLFNKIEDLLKSETANETSVDPNSPRGWFNPNATSKLIYRGTPSIDENFIKINLENANLDFTWVDDYWAYQPTGGYITFPGSGSDGRLGDPEEPDSAIRIYSDIREMKPQYLFKLYTQNEIDNIFQINLDGGGGDENSPLFKIKERRENLNKKLSEDINNAKGVSNQSTAIETKVYGLNSKSLLQTFNNDDSNDGLRLFTTLSIGDTVTSGRDSFDIEFSMTPFYLNNYNGSLTTKLLAGQFVDVQWADGDSTPLYIPFQMQSYHRVDASSGDYANASNFNTESLLPFYGQTMEIPGRGILKGVDFVSFNGSNRTTARAGLQDESPKANKDEYKDDGDTGDAYENWSAFDTLIQTPLWLDNVLRFRYAASRPNNDCCGPSNRYVTSPKMNSNDWGPNRPLTTSTYKFRQPKTNVVKTAYVDGDRINENDKPNFPYTDSQIQRRNLAYLFLSSCKVTPFITCGNTSMIEANEDDENKAYYTDKADHYPKALVPFVTSQGLVKIPKLWVYGIGAVMWRWKNYMGLSDIDGNLRWRHPYFKETPSGEDLLAQPGHPSVACDYSPHPLQGTGMKIGRKNRSTTIDGSTMTNATTSYANKLFIGAGLWPSAPVGSGRPQRSAFAATTLTDRGFYKAAFGGLNTADGISSSVQSSVNGRTKTYIYGAAFDYWGVYNNDGFLKTTLPQSLPYNNSNTYYYKPGVQDGLFDFFEGLVNGASEVEGSTGAWTDWYFRGTDRVWSTDGVNGETEEYGDDISETTNLLNPEPLLTQMKSAHEAAAHSYMPMLWIAPWQHFYTEPVAINNKKSSRKCGKAPESNSYGTWVEQVLTFIPMDSPFRDYVGNFGLLGDDNGNYTNRTVNATNVKLSLPIAASFTRKTFDDYYNGDKTVSQLLTSSYIQTGDGGTIKKEFFMTLEGGKYGDLMAILPTFVKETFVKEFETWCDRAWKEKYLGVIDPVNFGWETDGTSVPDVPKTPYTNVSNDGDTYAEVDLLGKSYRAKIFQGSASFPLSAIMGEYTADTWVDGAEGWFDPTNGFRNHYCSLIALDKSTNDSINQLEQELTKEYYYAMISTPRLFGLDHPNGDYGGYNSDGSDYQYYNATSRPAYSNNAFYANKGLVEIYLKAFQEEWKEFYQTKFSQLTDEENEEDNGSILEDDDIKLSLYRSFKSIVDKWISSTRKAKTGEKKLFFNITQNESDAAFDKSTTPLAGHFSYVNRVMGEIGNKAVLDVIKLEQIPDNPKKSFYNTISDLLGENKFDFFPLPSFTNFTNNNRDKDISKTAREMFEPYTGTIVKASGPQFICMYVGGTSRMVDLRTKGGNCKIDQEDLSFNDDGFEISDDTTTQKPPEYAKPMSEEPLAPFNPQYNYKDPTRIEGNGFTAFRVAYGIENQNMFKNIELDQSEFSETNESLMVIDRLAKGGDPADRTQKGNNLHNVYLTRSYTAKVESLGNMTIQPLQYFELTNIPMFYGTYLITEVSHNVKPNHINTNFKGTRQPIATVPVVEDVATAMNQSLQKIDPSGKKRNVLNGGFDAGSGNGNVDDCDNPNQTNNTITNNVSNNVVEGIPFVDIGKDDPSKYYNHAWKICSKCDKTKPGEYNSDGDWVAYGQPTANLDPNKVEYIGLHWTGGYQAVKNSSTLKKRGLHYTFEIDKDGTLYQLSDLNKVAYHGGNMNNYSIGISYAGGVENNKSATAYVRTIDDWNQEDLNLNGRDTFKAKKQFASIVDACTLAVKKYPNIKYITSHHFWSSNKGDVGNKFPYDILLSELKKRGINLTLKYSGDAPPGVTWTGRQQEAVSGTINDLSYDRTALQQETDGNQPNNDNNNVNQNTNTSSNGTAVAGNITSPKNINEALSHAGQI